VLVFPCTPSLTFLSVLSAARAVRVQVL